MAGVAVPRFIYGTAWKEGETQRLTAAALEAGFRAIDTANQRRHYFEEGVGNALRVAFAGGHLRREELFIQTKFTFKDGQDHRLPYDPKAPVSTQVAQSMASSLEHLGVEFVDSLVLHGPTRRDGLGPLDFEAWGAMEDLLKAGTAKALGASNISAGQLEELFVRARVKPTFVQNRCFTRAQADRAVREFCSAHGIVYQGFSLLTADPSVLRHPTVVGIAEQHAKTPAQVVFRHCVQAGILPLTGTGSKAHMEEAVAVDGFRLSVEDAAAVGRLLV